GKLRAKQVVETVLARPRAGFFTPIESGRPERVALERRASFSSTIVKTPPELHTQLAESVAPELGVHQSENLRQISGEWSRAWSATGPAAADPLDVFGRPASGVELGLQSPVRFQRGVSVGIDADKREQMKEALLRQLRIEDVHSDFEPPREAQMPRPA